MSFTSPAPAVHLQPIVDLATGRVLKHELSCDPADPGEQDESLILRALDHARGGHAVSVDVSVASLSDEGLPQRVAQAVIDRQIDATLLTFEITEDGLTTDAAAAFVRRVSALGCAVTVDHCGRGYAGLGYLKALPVDCLKIAPEFISQLQPGSPDEQLVRAVVHLARAIGMTAAAEGVPDAATRALLEDLGIEQAQGPAFGDTA